MTDYDNNMSGVLFKNDRKEKDTHPDYTGQCEIDGTEYWISAWIKTGKDGSKRAGEKFMSLAFKAKDTGTGQNRTNPTSNNNPQPADDDIPF